MPRRLLKAAAPTVTKELLDERPEVINIAWAADSLLICEREKDGMTRVRSERAPYCCFILNTDMTDSLRRALQNDPRVFGVSVVGDYHRVQFKQRDQCMDICLSLHGKGIQTYEGDVNPVRRWMTDFRPRLANHRVLYLDIETDSRVTFSRKEEMRVLCWAVEDEDGKRKVGVLDDDTDEAEARLLQRLLNIMQDYDLICAWNGDRFDFPVLFARFEKRRLAFVQARWLFLDQMLIFQRMNMMAAESGDEKTSMKLGDIATALLGVGKDEFDASKTYEAWAAGDEQRRQMVRYCVNDTNLLKRIEEKTGYVGLLRTLTETCNVFPDTRGANPTIQAEGFLLQLGADQGYRFPTVKIGRQPEKYLGAYVMEPQCSGITKNVHVADFAGLYPSIIVTWNMSPETLVQGELHKKLTAEYSTTGKVPEGYSYVTLTGCFFRTDQEGILPHAVKEVMRLRKYWNKLKSSLPPGTAEWVAANRKATAYKIAANSFYGVVGSFMSRFYSREVAESVTQAGKWLIMQTIDAAVARGMTAVYGDTDSVFIAGAHRTEFEVFVEACNVDLYPRVLQELGCKENLISLAYEKEFERLVICTAKKYCNPPEAPIWMGDLSFKPLGEVKIGDEVIGWNKGVSATRRKLIKTKVVAVHRHLAPLVSVVLNSGRTVRCTPDHRWLTARSRKSSEFVTAKVGRELAHIINLPPALTQEQQRAADWLGGIYDGEGSLSGKGRSQIVLAQSPTKNPEVCVRIEQSLALLNIEYTVWTNNGVNIYALKGNIQTKTDFVTHCSPAKRGRLVDATMKSRFVTPDEIAAIFPQPAGEVIGLTTESGNYVAWGYASKNCGRYVHYKGTNANEDSKPEVKGLEFKRGDSLKLTRTFQAEVVDLLVGMTNGGVEDPQTFVEVVERWQNRILHETLLLEDVVLAKRLNKSLSEYAQRLKNDGEPARQLPHIEIAKILAARGEDMGEGVKVQYFIADAKHKDGPLYLPVSEWKGQVDRFEVWEKMVYPPTERLLTAAFPTFDWSPWGKARPKAPRKKKEVASE